ncbi:MAG: hypothetical protein IAI48_00420 [Candidatus Eremiobacteraeota bacterium]|nr:hypothetical protein [Candidatus Eremiobacteraeota bacterium]
MIDEALRSKTMELLTGVDGDVARMLVSQMVNAGEIAEHNATTTIATILPPRSIWHAIVASHPRLADELERMPGAADAVKQVVYATWEFAFRSQRNVRDVEIREPRFIRAGDEEAPQLLFTLAALAPSGQNFEALPPRDERSMWPFIVKRNAQLADTFTHAIGMADAAQATVSAIYGRALTSGNPVNQIGLANGTFRPTPAGGELRFDFVHRPPKRGT